MDRRRTCFDVKPANILLDNEGSAWITDFGLARLEGDAGMTMSGDLLGTVRYMSPEQALAKRVVVDHRSDIYSLGVTLYEMLTLRPAFTGRDRQELLRQIAFDDPRSPRTLERSIPVDLETIVMKAAAKRPEDRYQSATALEEDLQRFVNHQPIHAKPPNLIDRTLKWSRRHTAVVWSACIVMLLACVSLAVSSYFIGRSLISEQQQRKQAEDNLRMARAVVDDIYVRFAEKWLENQPHFTDVQREVLEKAADFYESLPVSEKADPDTLRQVAVVQHRLGEIRCRLGQLEPATAAYGRSVACYEALAEKETPNQENLVALAGELSALGNHLGECYHDAYSQEIGSSKLNKRGFMVAHDNRVKARALLLRSLDLLGPMTDTTRSKLDIKKNLADTCQGLSWNYYRSEEFNLAEPFARRAVEVMESVLERVPDDVELQIRLARNCSTHATILNALKRTDEAEAVFRRAVEVGERALAADPANQKHKASHAVQLALLGDFLHYRRHDFSDIPLFEQSSKLQNELAKEYPDVPRYLQNSKAFI